MDVAVQAASCAQQAAQICGVRRAGAWTASSRVAASQAARAVSIAVTDGVDKNTDHGVAGRWHVLDLLVKDFLDALAHSRYRMVRPIEGIAVVKDEANVGDKFLGGAVARIRGDGVGLLRV